MTNTHTIRRAITVSACALSALTAVVFIVAAMVELFKMIAR